MRRSIYCGHEVFTYGGHSKSNVETKYIQTCWLGNKLLNYNNFIMIKLYLFGWDNEKHLWKKKKHTKCT